ncbi:MAG: hypothetical protein KatS3mg102_1162 [Planctomycetota bacterium]|nr:MAG: hypothetical protein KatS3mg102_1162 [Planctomycetota bacterium]
MLLRFGYEDVRARLSGLAGRLAGRRGARAAAWLLAGPDLLWLLGRVLADERVPRRQRGELIAAALYLASPVDLVPEALFGPVGLVDDATVLSRLLDTLLNRLPARVVEEHWPGDPQALAQLRALAQSGRRLFSLGAATGLRQLLVRALRQLRAQLPQPLQRWLVRAA